MENNRKIRNNIEKLKKIKNRKEKQRKWIKD